MIKPDHWPYRAKSLAIIPPTRYYPRMPLRGKKAPSLMFFSLGPHSFPVSAPYSEGHRLTPAEAAALNQLRTDNIKRTVRKEWEKRRYHAAYVLKDAELAHAQMFVRDLDTRYEFKSKDRGEGEGGSLEAEIALVALGLVEAEIRASADSEYWTLRQIELRVEERMSEAGVVELARERMRKKIKVNQGRIEDLLGE